MVFNLNQDQINELKNVINKKKEEPVVEHEKKRPIIEQIVEREEKRSIIEPIVKHEKEDVIIEPIVKKSKKEDEKVYDELSNTEIFINGKDIFILPKHKKEDVSESIDEKKIL